MTQQYVLHNGAYTTYTGEVSLPKKLPAGAYMGTVGMVGPVFEAHKFASDKLLDLPHGPASQVIKIINTFMSEATREKYRAAGLTYKRGVIMHGPPGSGKTVANRIIVDAATEKHDALTLVNPHTQHLRALVNTIKETEGNSRRIMVLWEEFENIATRKEAELLDLMDGVNQMEDILFLATTNHLDKIPKRFTERPSRFADVVYVGLPSKDVRRAYISAKAEMMGFKLDLEQTVDVTEGMSLDQVKNYMIFVALLEQTPDEAVMRLMGHKTVAINKQSTTFNMEALEQYLSSADRDTAFKVYEAWLKRDDEIDATEEEEHNE